MIKSFFFRLDNYYVHPTCTPTRAALLTGRYAANVGLGVAFVPGNPGGLEPEHVTMAEHLGQMGYTNHLVGKWHLGNSKTVFHPLKRGFHNFFGVLGMIDNNIYLYFCNISFQAVG